jgi:hypothetical protein
VPIQQALSIVVVLADENLFKGPPDTKPRNFEFLHIPKAPNILDQSPELLVDILRTLRNKNDVRVNLARLSKKAQKFRTRLIPLTRIEVKVCFINDDEYRQLRSAGRRMAIKLPDFFVTQFNHLILFENEAPHPRDVFLNRG